jgi:hypothetical protein
MNATKVISLTMDAVLVLGIGLCGLAGCVKAQQTSEPAAAPTVPSAASAAVGPTIDGSVRVPGGLSMSELQGFKDWLPVAPSFTDSTNVIRLMVANSVMISAYRQGIPANGKPFPEGSKMVKILWRQKKITDAPFSAAAPDTVPGGLAELEFIEKDSKRFPDTHGWGYAAFNYDAMSDKFSPVTPNDRPPQLNDAKCGATCHQMAASTDYVFTGYPKR